MKTIATLDYGRKLVSVTLDELTCDENIQRPVREKQMVGFKRNGGFKGMWFGMPHIDKNKHVIDGHTRIGYLRNHTEDGLYTNNHSDAIPQGKKAGDKVVVYCVLVDGDPVDGFMTLNDNNRCKEVEKFKACVNSDYNYDKHKELASLFETAGINIQYNINGVQDPNTTKNAQDLFCIYLKAPAVVSTLIEVLRRVYCTSSGTYESKALTRPFMVAMAQIIMENGTLTTSDLKGFLVNARIQGFNADIICQEAMGSGTGAKTQKVRAVLQAIINASKKKQDVGNAIKRLKAKG
jgi:hypothetical protein